MSAATSSEGFWIVEEGEYDVHPFTVRLLQTKAFRSDAVHGVVATSKQWTMYHVIALHRTTPCAPAVSKVAQQDHLEVSHYTERVSVPEMYSSYQ